MGELMRAADRPEDGDGLTLWDRHLLKKEVAAHRRDVVSAALGAQSDEVRAQLRHRHALAEQGRAYERGVQGLALAAEVYDALVDRTGGDPAKAEYLAPIALRGRDGIVGQV